MITRRDVIKGCAALLALGAAALPVATKRSGTKWLGPAVVGTFGHGYFAPGDVVEIHGVDWTQGKQYRITGSAGGTYSIEPVGALG